MKNTPDLRIYMRFGLENLMRYLSYMLILILEFWYDPTMFERMLVPFEPPYIGMGTKVCKRTGYVESQSFRAD